MSNTLYSPVGAGGHTGVIDCTRGSKPSTTHTIQAFPDPGVTGFTFSLWGSTRMAAENPVYPGDFSNISGDIAGPATTMQHVTYKPVRTVVCVCSALTGTGQVRFGYTGA